MPATVLFYPELPRPMRWATLGPSFSRRVNGGTCRFSDLPKVTHLVSGRHKTPPTRAADCQVGSQSLQRCPGARGGPLPSARRPPLGSVPRPSWSTTCACARTRAQPCGCWCSGSCADASRSERVSEPWSPGPWVCCRLSALR